MGCCLTGKIGRSVIVVVFLGTLLKEVRDADAVCVIKSLESAPNLRTLPRGVRDSLKSAQIPGILPRGSGDAHVVVNSILAPRGTEDGDVVVALGTLSKGVRSLRSTPNLRTLPKGVRDADFAVVSLESAQIPRILLRGRIDAHVVVNVLSAPNGTGDAEGGGCDWLAGCLSAYSPLLAELVESAADVLKFDLKFVLKTEPKGMDDNGGLGIVSELGSRLERGRNMELDLDCIPPSLKPLTRLEGKAGCHLDAYKLRIFLSIAAISGADICLTLM